MSGSHLYRTMDTVSVIERSCTKWFSTASPEIRIRHIMEYNLIPVPAVPRINNWPELSEKSNVFTPLIDAARPDSKVLLSHKISGLAYLLSVSV